MQCSINSLVEGGGQYGDQYLLLSSALPLFLLPPSLPPSQTNYEEYTPTGILKITWLHKQCHLVPSLVVFFFDLDWDDLQWEEKKTECASKIQVIRLVVVCVCV